MHRLEARIRTIPDFPKPGIMYRDVTPLLGDPQALGLAVRRLADPFAKRRNLDAVAGVEARGFIFGCLVARELAVPFVPIRKPGKLPYEKVSESYSLEYGVGTLEMHVDAIASGACVLLVDDLIATGGTAAAGCALIERIGGEVAGCCFVIELDGLGGRERLDGRPVHSVLRY